MRNPLASETSTNLGILVARLALGVSMLVAGYSQCLPLLELAAGGMLVLGLTTRVGGMLAAVITGIILSAHGLHLPPHADGHLPVYLSTAILLLCLGGGKLTLDNLLF